MPQCAPPQLTANHETSGPDLAQCPGSNVHGNHLGTFQESSFPAHLWRLGFVRCGLDAGGLRPKAYAVRKELLGTWEEAPQDRRLKTAWLHLQEAVWLRSPRWLHRGWSVDTGKHRPGLPRGSWAKAVRTQWGRVYKGRGQCPWKHQLASCHPFASSCRPAAHPALPPCGWSFLLPNRFLKFFLTLLEIPNSKPSLMAGVPRLVSNLYTHSLLLSIPKTILAVLSLRVCSSKKWYEEGIQHPSWTRYPKSYCCVSFLICSTSFLPNNSWGLHQTSPGWLGV